MKTITLVASLLGLAALGTVSMAHADDESATKPVKAEVVPAVPATPAAVDAVVYARKFTMTEGYKFRWCKEKPMVTSGYLLVLKVNKDLVFPRQCAEPVLFVGKQTAERLNVGYKSGYVVAIAPCNDDLNQTRIWFGTPQLPELVDQNVAEAEHTLANNAGIQPFSTKALESAVTRGADKLEASGIVDVLRVAADLIRQYSPDEEKLAKTLVPAPKPAPKAAPKPSTTEED